jgi:hypothetical protein
MSETKFAPKSEIQPMIVLPIGAMTPEDIKVLRDNGICVVECKEPGAIKFIDPIPSAVARTKIEDACIRLSRKILDKHEFHRIFGNDLGSIDQSNFTRLYVELLVQGTPLDPAPDEERRIFDQKKRAEIEKLAREEAREEAKARKAAMAAKAT